MKEGEETPAAAAEAAGSTVERADGPSRRARNQSMQEWLLAYENPLKRRFTREFFASIPRRPGVYRMYDRAGGLLYVGKAKDLRARLRSYRLVRPDSVSRKVIRLVNRIARIEWEECASEEAALLRENSLLREHRPPYNVVNTSPESYYLIAFAADGVGVAGAKARHFRFRLTTYEGPGSTGADGEELEEGFELFGAFKGRGTIRDGYGALIRLLWATQFPRDSRNEAERFQFPARLCASKPCYRFDLKLADHLTDEQARRLTTWVSRFLKGNSRRLLLELTEMLLANESIPPFCYHVIQDDLVRLEGFFARGPNRVRRLLRFERWIAKQESGLEAAAHAPGLRRASHRVAQAELDDLIVRYRAHREARVGAKSRRKRSP